MDTAGKKGVFSLAVGDSIGGYTVKRRLGKGGMGAVFLVSAANGKRYALKVMLPDEEDECGFRARFAREAEFAMNIRHRNLVHVYATGEDEETGLCYLVMDYMPGGSLADRLAKSCALPVDEAISIASKIAEGLDVAHNNGVIHRDIKPDNILFAADGTPKLADLGVAKFNERKTTLTTTGMIVGTPAYMAPEQMLDSRNVDGRADIYALGVVLYQMLAGKRPNENDSVMELMAKAIRGESLPDIRTLRPEVSAAVAYVLSRMCAPKPEDRPSTSRDVVRLFKEASSGNLKVPKSSVAATLSAGGISLSGAWRSLSIRIAVSFAVLIGFAALGMWLWSEFRQRERMRKLPSTGTNLVEHAYTSGKTAFREHDFYMLGEQAEKYVQMDGAALWAETSKFLSNDNRVESPPDPFTADKRIDSVKPMILCDALNMMGVLPSSSTNIVMLLWSHEHIRGIPLSLILNSLPKIHHKIRPLLGRHVPMLEIKAAILAELEKGVGASSFEINVAKRLIIEMAREEIVPNLSDLLDSNESIVDSSGTELTSEKQGQKWRRP